MSIQVKYHGVRGSVPVSGKQFIKYGGNTTCISFMIGDHFNIIDAGTGIRNALAEITKNGPAKKIRLFFTHTHLDHIQGFPFFSSLYNPSNHIEIYGETKKIITKNLDGTIISQENWSIQRILAEQQKSIFFPIETEEMLAKKVYHDLKPDHTYDFSNFKVTTLAMYHPNKTIGFRFDFDKGSFCFCTDVEHNEKMISIITQFAQGVDVFAYDSQYTQDEYDNDKKGWGHSTIDVGAKVACDAEVKEYHMIHHDPWHDDKVIDSMEEYSKKLFKNSFAVPEGHVITY